MIINKILKPVLVLLSITFIVFRVLTKDFLGDVTSTLLLVLLTTLYYFGNKERKPLFLAFLITFSISELLNLSGYFFLDSYVFLNFIYYAGNMLCMLSYIFLILLCSRTMRLKRILKEFTVTILILLVLGIFCVTLITETAESQLTTSEFIVEFAYNTVVMILLSVALLNYMDKENNKAMLFFIGSMLLFFSEMVQLAYYYIKEMPHLAAIYSIFLVLAFTFFYIQSQLAFKESAISSSNLMEKA